MFYKQKRRYEFWYYEYSYYLCSALTKGVKVFVIMKQVILSEEEMELIEAIRNVQKAYPNGYDELVWYAQAIFDDLVDLPK